MWGPRIADDTYSIRPNNLKRLVLLKICRGSMRLHLLAYRNLAPQFVGEVFEEDHLILRLLSFRCLDWH
jgi:hypothetical protein